MAINRRQFLYFMLASPAHALLKNKDYPTRFITSSMTNGKSQLHVIDQKLTIKSMTLPFQAHSYLLNPYVNHQCLVIGKRPSDLLTVIDTNKWKITKTIQLPYGRHFYGHGCFSDDKSRMFISENDFENEQGLISVWDAKTMQCIETFNSKGTGPHQLLATKGQLYCANGGIHTSPLYHRTQLSENILSNLSVFDQNNHQLTAIIPVKNSNMSARHLCWTGKKIVVGFQHKSRTPYQQQPLFMSLDQQKIDQHETHYFSTNKQEPSITHGHVTSIIASNDGHISIATLHKDGIIAIIDNNSNQVTKLIDAPHPQGLIINDNEILCSTKKGILRINKNTHQTQYVLTKIVKWDNHIDPIIEIFT